MAVGRPTIDPSWDDQGQSSQNPAPSDAVSDQGAVSSSQSPAAAPADQSTPEESQAIEAARSALLEQPTHEQLQPLEAIASSDQTPVPSSQPPALTKEDAATILDAQSTSSEQSSVIPAPGPMTAGISSPPAVSLEPPSLSPSSSQLTTPSQTAPTEGMAAAAPIPDLPVKAVDSLAQSLDQPDISSSADSPNLDQSSVPAPARIPQQERTQPLPPPGGHLPTYVKILFGLLFVVALAAAAYLGSEAGYLSLGIERLWGISNSPKQAMTSAAAALGSAASYSVEGDLSATLGGGQNQPAAGGDVADASGQTVSAQFRQLVATPLSQVDTSWTVGPSVASILLGSRLAVGGTVRAILQSDGQALYVRLNEGDQTILWTQTELSELAAFNLQPLQWQTLLESLAAAPDGKLLGGKTINGVKTKGYQYQVPTGTVLGLLSPPLAALTDSVTVEAWLDSKQALPQLITIKGAVQTSGSLTGQIVFGTFGAPSSIVLPTAEQVAAGTLSNWLEVNGIIGVQSASSRDATRRGDLDKIKQALEEYAAAQTPFGYPLTTSLVHLDQDTTVQAALAPYLQEIPKDPQQPDRYYGYQSDGQTYKLTAVAEEATGEDVSEIDGLKLITRTNQ